MRTIPMIKWSMNSPCTEGLADFVVPLSNGAGLCFSAALAQPKNVGLLVELKEDGERSPLRKSQPRDMVVIYSVG